MKARISKLGQAFLRNGKAAHALTHAVTDNASAIANGEPVRFPVEDVNGKKFTAVVRKVRMNRPE